MEKTKQNNNFKAIAEEIFHQADKNEIIYNEGDILSWWITRTHVHVGHEYDLSIVDMDIVSDHWKELGIRKNLKLPRFELCTLTYDEQMEAQSKSEHEEFDFDEWEHDTNTPDMAFTIAPKGIILEHCCMDITAIIFDNGAIEQNNRAVTDKEENFLKYLLQLRKSGKLDSIKDQEVYQCDMEEKTTTPNPVVDELHYVDWNSILKDKNEGKALSDKDYGFLTQSDHERKQYQIASANLYELFNMELRLNEKTKKYEFWTTNTGTRMWPNATFTTAAAAFVYFSEHIELA